MPAVLGTTGTRFLESEVLLEEVLADVLVDEQLRREGQRLHHSLASGGSLLGQALLVALPVGANRELAVVADRLGLPSTQMLTTLHDLQRALSILRRIVEAGCTQATDLPRTGRHHLVEADGSRRADLVGVCPTLEQHEPEEPLETRLLELPEVLLPEGEGELVPVGLQTLHVLEREPLSDLRDVQVRKILTVVVPKQVDPELQHPSLRERLSRCEHRNQARDQNHEPQRFPHGLLPPSKPFYNTIF